MCPVLILAYGNPLRSDDGVAWRAAEALDGKDSLGDVEILCLHQLSPELAEPVSRSRCVIFVDAARAADGESAGKVQLKEITAQPAGPAGNGHSSHNLSPSAVLDLAARLYDVTPKAFCVTITGSDFGHGESLSPVVAAALPGLIRKIESLIARFAPATRQALES